MNAPAIGQLEVVDGSLDSKAPGGDIRTLEERFPDIIPIGMAPVPGSPAGE